MDFSCIFDGKAAEVFYRVVPKLGLVPSEKRARNMWCEYQRALLTGKKVAQPWPGVVVRKFGGKFVIFRGELEAAANDAQRNLNVAINENEAAKSDGTRRRGRPPKIIAKN